MDLIEFNDLETLGRKIREYTQETINLRALIEGRETLAKGLREKYPNMKMESIRSVLRKQEREQTKLAQISFDEMRVYALSCGWTIDYKDIGEEVSGLLRKPIADLSEIEI